MRRVSFKTGLKTKMKKRKTKLTSYFTWKKKQKNGKDGTKEAKRRSTVFDRYPEAFVEAVRGTPMRPPQRRGSLAESYAACIGVGMSAYRPGLSPDSECDLLPVAGQMRLEALENAEKKRQREKTMDELNSVLARVGLAIDEFNTAEDELDISESPDPELEAEEEERKMQERQMKKMRKRARRRKEREQEQKEEKVKRKDTQEEAQEQLQVEEEGLLESSEDSSETSDEEEDEDEGGERTKEKIWTMPRTLKRKVSRGMLLMRAKRRRVLKNITSYVELCMEREDIIRQMQSWIEATVDEELSKPTRMYLFSPNLIRDNRPTELASDIDTLECTLVRLKGIADCLGIGDVGLDEEQDEGTEKTLPKRRPRPKTLYNVDELDNAENWSQALADIDKNLQQAIKVIPVRKIRLNVEQARKQFALMSQLMQKRKDMILELDSKVINVEGELVKAKRHADELRKTNKKVAVKAEKFKHQCEDLQNKINEQQKHVNELNEMLEDYKKKESFGLYKSSSESMTSGGSESVSVISLVDKPSRQLAPTGEKFIIKTPKSSKVQIQISPSVESTKPPPLSSEETNEEIAKLKASLQRVEEELKIEQEKSAAFEVEFTSLQSDKVKIEQERSDLEIQLEDVKRENERAVEDLNHQLEDAERINKRLTGEVECNEEIIKYQEERLGQFMEEIQCLEERMMSFPPTPATMSVASMAGGPRRERRKTSLQLGLEPQTARQMMAKVKQQCEAEVQSLKDHMAKENQRHQAEIRRYEQDHKKDVQNIHKEALLLLRALNRFKDCVATMLDREQLSQEAHAIRSHAPLPLDENFGDTRQMLARMAILSNEMLISVEMHLSRGLMSKRLESKDTNIGKMEHHGSMQMGTAKRMSDDLQGQQLESMVWKLLEEGKRQEVMEKFRDVLLQISGHRKEILSARKASEDSMSKKDAQIKRVLRREVEIKKKVDDQKTIIKNLASIWKSRRIGQKYIRRKDQQRNLQLLEEAMKANEVSKELYESTKKLIKDAMEFPRKRFIEMVKNYVHFRRIRAIQQNVRKMKMESNVGDRVLLAMKETEERMIMQKETWRLKRDEFIKARSDVLEQLHKVLTEVNEETGILLTKPIELIPRLEQIKEDVKEIDEADILEAVNIPKERAKLRKAQLQAQAAIKEPPLSPVDGTAVPREEKQEATWKVMSTFPPAMVTTPRLLDLDINRSRLAAQDILARLSQGSLDDKSISLPPSSFFPSLYGYYKKPDDGIRKIRSEPKRTNIVRTLKTRARFLPPIATLYPENGQKEAS